MTIEQDDRGTYILNSKDLNLSAHVHELVKAGVCSFKIEGRMKSEYYLATVINAYRRILDAYAVKGEDYLKDDFFTEELDKTAHREFTTAFLFGENDRTENFNDSQSRGTRKYIANVLDYDEKNGYATVEMRNRFKAGDVLEVLSPSDNFNKKITAERITDENGNAVEDAKIVQQKLRIYTKLRLSAGDILRAEI